MACKSICELCPRLVISTAVNFDAASNTIIVGLPAGTYNAGEKYCIVIAQTIPAAVTVGATVAVSIGTSPVRYPVNNCDCTPLTACGLHSRTKYSTCLIATAAGATFRMLGKACRCTQQAGAGSITG